MRAAEGDVERTHVVPGEVGAEAEVGAGGRVVATVVAEDAERRLRRPGGGLACVQHQQGRERDGNHGARRKRVGDETLRS